MQVYGPFFSSEQPQSNDFRKLEVIGTRSSPSELAISNAIDFHNAIGSKRKEERLRFLKNYWCEKVSKHPRIKLHNSLKPEYACAIGNFSIDGLDSTKINALFLFEHQIHMTPMVWENVNGLRVSPNIYTSTKDLDQFVDAVFKIAAS